MKVAFLLITCAHALLHVLGFVKAFGLNPLPQLTIPISRPLGLLWLAAALLLIAYAALFALQHRTAWIVGCLAVILSQALIFYFWKDARFGTVPNVLVLAVVAVGWGQAQFAGRVQREQVLLLAGSGTSVGQTLAEDHIRHLPTPVKAWLRACGAVGREMIVNGRLTQKALIKMKPDQHEWLHATAEQYTTVAPPAFIWTVDLPLNAVMNVRGRDKFENGKGEMLIKLNSLFDIVHANGPKIDEGSLQRFLGELVWFPSLALSPNITWHEIDSLTAEATLQVLGTTGSGTFYFNPQGDFVKFVALRFQGDEADAQRKEWILTVDGYRVFHGIKIPSRLQATCKLEQGDWNWLHMEVTDVTYNLPPNKHP